MADDEMADDDMAHDGRAHGGRASDEPAPDDSWVDLAAELRTSLADGLDVAGTIDEVEVMTMVGRVGVDIIIEASDLTGRSQREAYAVLCDLLATRVAGGADQVLGCLVFATEPDPEALASALDGMVRDDRRSTFTPVVPLGRAQAQAMADAGVSIDGVIDAATDLVAVAADRRPATVETAETFLAELDELIDRRLRP